ncbi:HD family phosphohydrolase [Candidatus Desulfarcum epimagneticum]|uniref:HD family phosphohydrolase n=1 Tax=uncultured Desulfobacteraceae bacterium TaxID=218296 RepID=A0A484HJM8_9BACT|nr:HD family phosphohydrolase [uncultured Desulfobacteraceae bacterium]
MKKQFIDQLKAGDSLGDVFALSEKNLLRKKDGEPYLNVTLSDRTGTLKGVAWDNVAEIRDAVSSGDIVFVTGRVSEYRGSLQAVVADMKAASPYDRDPADFLPATDKDIEAMFSRLKKVLSAIETPHFKRLLDAFFEDEDFAPVFKAAPAAKSMHHAYIGGLLEHTLSMCLLIDKIGRHYAGINTDLLLVGAALHDIGKIREFEWTTRIDYSDKGRLVGHIIMGCAMIDERIARAGDFPEKDAVLLRHMVAAHHGSREFGSPEPPKTLEALLLHMVDDMDAKMNGVREFIMKQDPDESWTPYHRLLERHFYVPES